MHQRASEMFTLASLAVASFATVAAALDPLGAIVDTSPCPIPASRYRSDTVVVPITNASNITARLKYPTTQHVTLEVQNDLTDVQWFLNSSYSNTTIVSKCGVGYSITAPNASVPIIVNVASDIFIHALRINVNYNWSMSVNDTGYFAPYCSDPNVSKIRTWVGAVIFSMSTPLCPAILAFAVKRLQIAGNAIYGRTTLSNCTDTLFENNFVTTHGFAEGVHVTDVGDVNTLAPATLTVRNNVINDTLTGVMLGVIGTGTSVGAQIVNNNITNFYWTSVQFGMGMHNVDSISNYFAYNYIHRSRGYPISGDSGAIYMDTHWFGINNTIYHNYIYQRVNSYCIYIDYVTSDTKFIRNICDGGGLNFKINTGRNNIVKDFLAIGTNLTFMISCQNANSNNCNPGGLGLSLWNPTLYSNPAWSAAAPWAATFCTDKSVNGIRCNANDTMDAVYGNCSGLPVLNEVRFASVNSTNVSKIKLPPTGNATGVICGVNATNVDLLNTFNQTAYASQNLTRGSDGLVRIVPNSQLARDFPNLASFDISLVGVKASNQNNYLGLLPPPQPPQPTATLTTTATDGSNGNGSSSSSNDNATTPASALNQPSTAAASTGSGMSSGAVGGITAAVSFVGLAAAGVGAWTLHRRGVFSKMMKNGASN